MSENETGLSLTELATIVTAVVAVAAFFRPELFGLFRKSLNRINYYPVGLIEIGFANFGPTLGLIGSLRATPYEQHVSSISLALTRVRDKATHNFSWAVFRPLSFFPNAQAMDIASSFSIASGASKSMNIQYHDGETRQRIEAPLTELIKAWTEYLQSNQISAEKIAEVGANEIYLQFQNPNPTAAEIYGRITREFYWEAGDYKVEMTIETDGPKKDYEFHFDFSISGEEADRLRLNVVHTMAMVTHAPEQIPNFVNVECKNFKKLDR